MVRGIGSFLFYGGGGSIQDGDARHKGLRVGSPVANVQRHQDIRGALAAIAFGCARTHHLPMANQMELSMVKAFCCRFCRVEIEPVGLADGSAALICIDCDLIGIEHEIVRGASMQPAGLRSHGLARAKPARSMRK
jgi:hypothetical protein